MDILEENLPAEKTRKLIYELLREASIISPFDKESSFDRLFPNQDFHSGKGLGNLIALPLNGKSLLNCNSAFLNPEDMEPYSDQLETIKSFQKLTSNLFKSIYEEIYRLPILKPLNLWVLKYSMVFIKETRQNADNVVIFGQLSMKK